MARGVITRDSDGKTVDLDKQDAEQADVTYFAKKVKIVDSVGEDITANNPLPTTSTIITGDIEIGAVELKDGSSDIRATISTKGSTNIVHTGLFDENGTQLGTGNPLPISIDTLPLPSGESIELTQSSIKSLIETLQELTNRLAVLSSVKGVNESLRVTPIISVSTAVTGPITNAQFLLSVFNQNQRGVYQNIYNTIGI